MSKKVHVSPSGVGFIKTDAKKEIPGAPEILKDAKRRPWLEETDNDEEDE